MLSSVRFQEYIIAEKEITMLERNIVYVDECFFLRVWPSKIGKAPFKSIFEKIFKF